MALFSLRWLLPKLFDHDQNRNILDNIGTETYEFRNMLHYRFTESPLYILKVSLFMSRFTLMFETFMVQMYGFADQLK